VQRDVPVRWYADESVLGFGKLLAAQRADVTYPGHPAVPEILPGALDVDWMPIVAEFGWVVFHRDRRIRTRPAEVRIFAEEGLKAVWFAGSKDLAPRQQLDLALRHWARLEREVIRLGPGPWALNLIDSGLREVPLRAGR
jgi:PIN like domain